MLSYARIYNWNLSLDLVDHWVFNSNMSFIITTIPTSFFRYFIKVGISHFMMTNLTCWDINNDWVPNSSKWYCTQVYIMDIDKVWSVENNVAVGLNLFNISCVNFTNCFNFDLIRYNNWSLLIVLAGSYNVVYYVSIDLDTYWV